MNGSTPKSSQLFTSARRFLVPALLVGTLCLVGGSSSVWGADSEAATRFRQNVQPVLKEFCFDCHGDGESKGSVSFDDWKPEDAEQNHPLWAKVLKNVRAGLMPPAKKPRPSNAQQKQLEDWIKYSNFAADPANPDPGRVTVRRLNRVEYRNTVRDLLGVDFDTEKEFPPDDAGHGFDNIADVLTLPPMLLEKYFAAAKTVVTRAVPAVPKIPAESVVSGKSFHRSSPESSSRTNRPTAGNSGALSFSYYETAFATNPYSVKQAGRYQVVLDFTANERFVDNQFDYNKCRFVFRVDGHELLQQEQSREGGKPFHFEFDQDWTAGEHELMFEVLPLTPDKKQVRSLSLEIDSITVRGPMDPKSWVQPKNYARYFPKQIPSGKSSRHQYAREILEPFVRKAYRHPVESGTVDQLVSLAESTSAQKGKTFEEGIGQAMIAVLASPRFLFREEAIEPISNSGTHPWVDEFALASRLSYFYWSSMPDDELFRLAGERKLRANLKSQMARLLADRRAEGLVRNFVGQWLQARDVENVQIDARQVLFRESAPDPDFEKRRQRFRELRDRGEDTLLPTEKKEVDDMRAEFSKRFSKPPRAELNTDLRRAMRQETEKVFEYVLREDRSLLELLDSNYTFLNERLAGHYGLTNLNINGDEMRRVTLPADSPRGGILTQGSVLAVTSNPTRTSPVKRGLFVLDNILGTPPPPPPPDIPPLEDAAKAMKEKTLSLRETLALHREKPLCSSCHNRMDPLGLALENFNALGMWREQERGQSIDATGKLLSGESFANVKELKQILATRHATEFYRTMTEKLLTYALGRGLDYYDVATVDTIVESLEQTKGSPSALLTGITESAAFQKARAAASANSPMPAAANRQRAELRTKP